MTSPAAKRTYLRTFLFIAASLALLCIAALTYPVFYYSYVPKKVVTIPVHLQYKYVYHLIIFQSPQDLPRLFRFVLTTLRPHPVPGSTPMAWRTSHHSSCSSRRTTCRWS